MVTIENNCFSIPQICESGQCFRLDAVSEDTYELLAGSRYLKIGIRQKDLAGETDGSGKADVYGETILYCTQAVRRKNMTVSGKNTLIFRCPIRIILHGLTQTMII